MDKIKVVKVEVQPMGSDDLRKARNGQKKARMYFFADGENAPAREARPKVLYRPVFDEVFEKAGIEKPKVITWDQRAGCASDDSTPGFVLDGVHNVNIHVNYEVVTQTEPEVEEPKVEEQRVVERPVLGTSVRDANGRFLPKSEVKEEALEEVTAV